ncbi:MAG: DUF5074 domain-containing protein [Muribaculaceae bacterium]|nr:DUF5074 domain-containing protein [Muribaculaceae bacterium]
MRTKPLSLVIGLSALTAAAHPIDFSQIRHWTGSGPNEAALVIQFNGDTYGNDAYVWGYRWEDGESPNGETMMKAICSNSARLAMLTQHTGSMGSTLCGVGYSMNQEILRHIFFNFDKAKDFEFINFDYYNVNSFMGQTQAPGDNAPAIAREAIQKAIAGTHFIQHPFDYDTYGYPAYDYDCWDIDEETENLGGMSAYEPKWLAAWYEGYWSYWCANSPSQDWMYSGSGFTGRPLVNGSVDGWSFTEFENPMVGGMGEGVAPCESGGINYIPPRLLDKEIMASKCVRTVGKGGNSIPLIVRFAGHDKIDNVVVRLMFNSVLPSADEVLNILGNDPSFSFDGNRLSIDADGDGVFDNSGDDTSAEGDWTLMEYEDCVLLSCVDDKAPEYLLYLPPAGVECAVIPEEMTFALSDIPDHIPVFVQRADTYDAINYSWYRRSDDNLTHSSNSSDIVSGIGTGASNFGQLTYTGNKAGELYMHVRVRTGKGASYSYSNVCRFTLLPPEVPVERIEFLNESMDAPLNAVIDNPLTLYPENATYTGLTYATGDSKVATASATAIKTTKTAGSTTITVSSKWNPDVKASFEVVSELRHPVTDFVINDVEGDVITLNPKQMLGIIARPVPENADIPDYNVTLEGNGTAKEDLIASMYKVNYWDENNTRIQFYELSGHRAGECVLKLTSTDGSDITKTFIVKVEEQDRTPLDNGYVDGTLLLNEEWFGHTNGGMNYLTPDGEMMYQVYERENPGMSFGCTSQYATIWADRLIAISKQAVDAGDPLPGGGRVVVADAKTLKRQGSIADLKFGDETKSADGRAVVGATPDKVYVGTSNGIYIVDLNEIKVIGKITAFDETGSAGTDLYSGQIGDMVHSGKYVFGIKQATGAFAIDTETDRVVWNYPLTTVQGITQTADGHVWLASTAGGCGVFTCIDPETLEVVDDMGITLPEGMPYPTCSWGAWRNTPFVGSHTANKIWFSAGGGIAGGSSKDKFYCWEVGTDPDDIRLVFDMESAGLTGSNPRVKQKTYGTLRYDERSGELIVMTTEDSASGHYRYNWTHFVDPESGEIKRTIALRPYYWFQAFAIFPDKHDAEISLDEITVDISENERIIDLAEFVSDKDNIDSNIRLSLLDTPVLLSGNEDTAPHAEVKLNGRELSIVPKSAGTHVFTLAAESNGRRMSKTVSVNVHDTSTGIDEALSPTKSVTCDGRRIHVEGFDGQGFTIHDIAGRMIGSFHVDNESYIFDFGNHNGIYVLKADCGFSTKVIIVK